MRCNMKNWLNVEEAMTFLEEHYIYVSYKTFTSWLRNGEIPAIASDNRKEGWAIRKEDIFAFADKKRPGLRGILEGYHGLVEDMEKVKQQVKVLMENECDVGWIDKEGILNSSSAEFGVHNDVIEFLYEFIEVLSDELQEVKKQNEWMNQAYEQLVGDYNFLYEELKMHHENDEELIVAKDEEVIGKEEVAKIDEETFFELVQVQWEKKFPNEIFCLGQEEIKELYTIFYKKLYQNGGDEELAITKQGDVYICPVSQKKYKHINRIYNPVIRRVLDNTQGKILKKQHIISAENVL